MDYDNDQSLILALNAPARRRDAINQLQAIAHCICFDGRVTDDEVAMLSAFMLTNSALDKQWPFDRIWGLLDAIRADAIVTLDERVVLLRTLREFALQDPEAQQKATGAIFDDDIEIDFVERSFVTTGVLAFGKRGPFQARLVSVGATIHNTLRRDTDFLIVGTKGSDAWMAERYGTKIDGAMQAKRGGAKVRIVREPVAIEALLLAEQRR